MRDLGSNSKTKQMLLDVKESIVDWIDSTNKGFLVSVIGFFWCIPAILISAFLRGFSVSFVSAGFVPFWTPLLEGVRLVSFFSIWVHSVLGLIFLIAAIGIAADS